MRETVDFGMDLGTTNSSIAAWSNGSVRVFRNLHQSETTPSAVYVDQRGTVYVGQRAYERLTVDAANAAAEFKRQMGTGDEKLFASSGIRLSPEQLSAEVLKSLCSDVSRSTGEQVDQAVITVPAAFLQPQCEATRAAAHLAGIEVAALLQEPIAAAIAYGYQANIPQGCWIVYDLGGGTFDCAVVAARDNRITVLEHRGNERLGGKDFDNLIVDQVLIPVLTRGFDLPDLSRGTPEYARLIQRVKGQSERARIELSAVEVAQVPIFDAGTDRSHRLIEIDIDITRERLDGLLHDMIMETITLCEEALRGCGVSPQGVDSMILVGGPTLAPGLRAMLGSELGVRLDASLDPLTVVATGAAIYASGLKRTGTTTRPAHVEVLVDLQYEPVWSEAECLVAGSLKAAGQRVSFEGYSCQVDALGGHWSSGRIPVRDATFAAVVRLLERQENHFAVRLFDGANRLVPVEPAEFVIRHGWTASAPPLPHSIGVEIREPITGRTEIDVIFPRGVPLPVKESRVFKAAKTLSPEVPGESLDVKVWEGEYAEDPQANHFIGSVRVISSQLTRALPEGSDLEVDLEVDTSRHLSAHVTVPYLGLTWEDTFDWKPARLNLADQVAELETSVAANHDGLQRLREAVADEAGRDDLAMMSTLEARLRQSEENLQASKGGDVDAVARADGLLRGVRGEVARLRKRFDHPIAQSEYKEALQIAERAVRDFGDDTDQAALETIRKDGDKALAPRDTPLIRFATEDLENLKWRLLFAQPWFWMRSFEQIEADASVFRDDARAAKALERGRGAMANEDLDALKECVWELWGMMPEALRERERAIVAEAGIRRA